MVYGIYPRCYEAKPSNPKGIPYTTASEESMWLVPQLTAFHQSQAEKSIPLGNTFGFRQIREQRFEKCGLCDRKNTRGRGLWGKTQVSARVRSTSGEPRVVPHNLGPEEFFLSCSMASSLQPISGREKVGSRTQEVHERNSEG